MNNEIQNWKCPNCDTLNTGRRCVICGGEKPDIQPEIKSTMSKSFSNENKVSSNKGIIIVLCSVIGVLLVGIIILCIVLFAGIIGGEAPEEQPNSSHEIKAEIDENEEEKEKAEKKDKYISDPVYSIKFNLSVDKHTMEKNPTYETKSDDYMTYAIPNGFKSSDNGRYFSKDSTAYIRYMKEDKTEIPIPEIIAQKKSFLGGNVYLENTQDNWYVLSTLRNEVIYYTKSIVDENYVISFMFVYPEEYRDIYDDYVDDIIDGFELPDRSGIEIIEE